MNGHLRVGGGGGAEKTVEKSEMTPGRGGGVFWYF